MGQLLITGTITIDRRGVVSQAHAWTRECGPNPIGGWRKAFRRALAKAWAEARNERTRVLFTSRRAL